MLKSLRIISVVMLLITMAINAAADSNLDNPQENMKVLAAPISPGITNAIDTMRERFQSFDKNYMMWQWTKGDEQSMEVQYSLKYIYFKNSVTDDTEFNSYFSYTGKFDFYMETRDSGPVINRVSNPALHFRLESKEPEVCRKTRETLECQKYKMTKKYPNFQWIDFAVEHRSDGQVVDAKAKDDNPASPTFGKYLAQIEYEKGNHQYFDSISRGSNYFSLSAGSELMKELLVEVSPKLYFTNDSDITWGKYAGSGTSFTDFDLLRTKATYTWYQAEKERLTLGLEYTIGKKAFATDSLDVYLIVPCRFGTLNNWNLPLMLKAHTGPMDRLSDYSKPINSIGVGVAFAYY